MFPIDTPSPFYMLLFGVLPFAVLAYVFLFWDSVRENSPSKGDNMLGVKTVVATLMLTGFLLAIAGLFDIIYYILSFDSFDLIKRGLPNVLAGAITVGAMYFLVLPKTNWQEYPKAARMVTGSVALVAGVIFVISVGDFLYAVFDWPSWKGVARRLALVLVTGPTTFAGLYFFARQAGLELPDVAEIKQLSQQAQAGLRSGGGAPAPAPQPPQQPQYSGGGGYEQQVPPADDGPRTTAIPTPGSQGWDQAGGGDDDWGNQGGGQGGGWGNQGGGGQGGGGGWGNQGGGGGQGGGGWG